MKKYLIVDIETTGLDPLVNEITCIGFVRSFDSKETEIFINGQKKTSSEKELLNVFWDKLLDYQPDYLVGWNIDNFDWKFLKIRSLLNGVRISKYYKKKDRIDLMVLLKTPKYRSLDSYSEALLKEGKDGMDPIACFQNKDFEALKKYNQKDLELTYKIFKRCVDCGVIVENDNQ